MSFATLGAAAFLLGLAGLAGGLYLLQRLRVRHRRVSVVTTMFWDEAREESRARVLVRRFRHPWAYALVLAVAAAMWTALAGPRADRDRGEDWVLVLDGSAAMRGGDRFAAALDDLRAALEEIPDDHREVRLDAGRRHTLLAPGEPARLLEERLGDLGPRPAPSGLASIVDERALVAATGRRQHVLVFGLADLSSDRRKDLPDRLELRRIAPPGSAGSEAEITALGAAPAASGDVDRVDLLVEFRGDGDTAEPAITLDGAAVVTVADPAPEGRGRRIARDLPADGGLVEARLGEDVARYVLPRARAVRVGVDAGVPSAFAAVVEHDPGLVGAAEAPEVRIADREGAEPALVLVGAGQNARRHDPGRGAAGLAATCVPSSRSSEASPPRRPRRRRLRVASSRLPRDDLVVGKNPSWTRRASRCSSPGRSAGSPIDAEDPPSPAPERPWRSPANFPSATRTARDSIPAGADFRPPVAGLYVREDGDRLAAALGLVAPASGAAAEGTGPLPAPVSISWRSSPSSRSGCSAPSGTSSAGGC
ncbi:MAG: BatA domain-containing protein [Planctomycetota bacterium]